MALVSTSPPGTVAKPIEVRVVLVTGLVPLVMFFFVPETCCDHPVELTIDAWLEANGSRLKYGVFTCTGEPVVPVHHVVDGSARIVADPSLVHAPVAPCIWHPDIITVEPVHPLTDSAYCGELVSVPVSLTPGKTVVPTS